jgi:acetyl/propionyl-CoA carboxylase alpha subunit
MKYFKKVLVANRGEIAVRVMRTLSECNIASVAVYSDADLNSTHVRCADQAVCIGGTDAASSYLNIDAVLAAARETGAEAVHPGYGFLAENPAFGKACESAGLTFIGPTPEAMEAMGDKSTAREAAKAAGAPTVPGVPASDDPAEIDRNARALPLPVLLKAAAGGGGKGMRRVAEYKELPEAIKAAQREGLKAFGDSRLIVESYIHPVRHVEVQVVGDGQGKVVALGERECSLQRRHQKIIEETPSPGTSAGLRPKLWTSACDIAAAVRYRGAGTVEFLVTDSSEYYFLEMNARLQVEHPVTELCTGFDLVQWQLAVAAGSGLPCEQSDIKPRGAAMEARLYAEDPDSGFLPTAGDLLMLRWPNWPNVRIDTGIEEGQSVTPHYDPMIAKVITWGESREVARIRLTRALEHTVALGLSTNQAFLLDLLESDFMCTGATYTHTVEEWMKGPSAREVPDAVLAALAVGGRAKGARKSPADSPGATAGERSNPWQTVGHWRV